MSYEHRAQKLYAAAGGGGCCCCWAVSPLKCDTRQKCDINSLCTIAVKAFAYLHKLI